MNLFLRLSEQFDPSGFAAAGGVFFIGIVLYLVALALVVFGTYWLIRLAVRHGTMDTARWQAAGMPPRGSRRQQR